MPSSLVFAALVLAWLAVLVPIVARRRQTVPRPAEADLSARVLPRSAAAPAIEELPVTHHSRARASGSTAVADRDLDGDLDGDLGGDHDGDLDRELDRELDPDSYGEHDQYDEYDEYGEYGEYDEYDEYGQRAGDEEPGAALVPTPRSYRPGRGGFDPDAAALAAENRYAFRQRVALGLIAVAVLSALAALVVTPALWWLHLVADVALVGYLVFLRRQTRIEEDLRTRRAARLTGERRALEARRERQAEHEQRMASVRREEHAPDADAEDGYDGYDDDLDGADEPRRWAAPRTPAPAVPDGLELVSGSEDDPAFHQLDGRESVPAYRRAAGA